MGFNSAQLLFFLGGVTIKGGDTFVDAHTLKERGLHMYGVNTGETSSNFPPISADDSPSLAQCLLISLFTQANSYGFHIFHRRGSSNLFIENYEAGMWTSWKKIPSVSI